VRETHPASLSHEVLDKLFIGSRLHEHADPAQRVVGVAALPRDSKALAQMLGADPSPDVRAAAATHCSDPAVLAAALRTETVPQVSTAIAASLGKVLAARPDDGSVRTFLAAPECPDVVRAQFALHTQDEERRRVAIDGISDEEVLVDVALDAEHASVRIARPSAFMRPNRCAGCSREHATGTAASRAWRASGSMRSASASKTPRRLTRS
jgi:hypothetical protein